MRALTQLVDLVTRQRLVDEGVSIIADFIYCLVHTEWIRRTGPDGNVSLKSAPCTCPSILCLLLLLSHPEPHSFVLTGLNFLLSHILCL